MSPGDLSGLSPTTLVPRSRPPFAFRAVACAPNSSAYSALALSWSALGRRPGVAVVLHGRAVACCRDRPRRAGGRHGPGDGRRPQRLRGRGCRRGQACSCRRGVRWRRRMPCRHRLYHGCGRVRPREQGGGPGRCPLGSGRRRLVGPGPVRRACLPRVPLPRSRLTICAPRMVSASPGLLRPWPGRTPRRWLPVRAAGLVTGPVEVAFGSRAGRRAGEHRVGVVLAGTDRCPGPGGRAVIMSWPGAVLWRCRSAFPAWWSRGRRCHRGSRVTGRAARRASRRHAHGGSASWRAARVAASCRPLLALAESGPGRRGPRPCPLRERGHRACPRWLA